MKMPLEVAKEVLTAAFRHVTRYRTSEGIDISWGEQRDLREFKEYCRWKPVVANGTKLEGRMDICLAERGPYELTKFYNEEAEQLLDLGQEGSDSTLHERFRGIA